MMRPRWNGPDFVLNSLHLFLEGSVQNFVVWIQTWAKWVFHLKLYREYQQTIVFIKPFHWVFH